MNNAEGEAASQRGREQRRQQDRASGPSSACWRLGSRSGRIRPRPAKATLECVCVQIHTFIISIDGLTVPGRSAAVEIGLL